jgi:hypothetical protein
MLNTFKTRVRNAYVVFLAATVFLPQTPLGMWFFRVYSEKSNLSPESASQHHQPDRRR